MNDERRERYADAITSAGDTAYGYRPFYDAITHAAMAVADEEISAELSTQDGYTAKMRDEIERWRIENARLRAELVESADTLDESAQLLEDALNENARLRAELEASARELSSVVDDRNMYQHKEAEAVLEASRLRAELERSQAEEVESRIRASEAEATISRVRAVLARWRDGDVHYPYLAVRNALNGESE